jgi:rhodanese-related sulfurtransferase
MKAKIYTIASALGALSMLFSGTSRVTAAPGAELRQVSADQAEELIKANMGNKNFVILDIRTPGEYSGGHIPNAVLLDFHSPSFRENLAGLDKNKTYLMYCRSGNRSGRAMSLFSELGFARVLELRGGIKSWIASGRTLR